MKVEFTEVFDLLFIIVDAEKFSFGLFAPGWDVTINRIRIWSIQNIVNHC